MTTKLTAMLNAAAIFFFTALSLFPVLALAAAGLVY